MSILKMPVLTALMIIALIYHAIPGVGQSSLLAITGQDISPIGLASSSEFGVIGTVTDTTGVRKRLPPEELVKLDDLSKVLGGTIFKIHIEEVLTKRSDFGKARSVTAFANGDLFIFRRRDAPYFPNELYQRGQRYLIFVSPIPNQDELSKSYELDAKTIYYQAFEPNKGIVRLKSLEDPVALKFRQLGQAIQPLDPNEKLQRLKVLTRSRDTDVSQMAEEAIKLIQHNMRN